MVNIIRSFSGLIVLLVIVPLLCHETNEVELFSLDYLYPQTYFFRVEAASKELWNDIDLFLVNKESLEHALSNNYLQTQFKKLYAAAKMLLVHKNEARNYLVDDIEYLLGIVELLDHKSQQLLATLPLESEGQDLYQLLVQTYNILKQLMIENGEVVLI